MCTVYSWRCSRVCKGCQGSNLVICLQDICLTCCNIFPFTKCILCYLSILFLFWGPEATLSNQTGMSVHFRLAVQGMLLLRLVYLINLDGIQGHKTHTKMLGFFYDYTCWYPGPLLGARDWTEVILACVLIMYQLPLQNYYLKLLPFFFFWDVKWLYFWGVKT